MKGLRRLLERHNRRDINCVRWLDPRPWQEWTPEVCRPCRRTGGYVAMRHAETGQLR